MAASRDKIVELRALIGSLQGGLKRDAYASRLLPCPIPKGVLIELTGGQKTAWLLDFLKEHETLRVFWFEKRQTIFPASLHQRGIGLERIVFATIPDLFEAARRVIQSQAFPIVVMPSTLEDTRMLKALQLMAEKANTTVFLMSRSPTHAWPIHVQLNIGKGSAPENLKVTIIKHKQGDYA